LCRDAPATVISPKNRLSHSAVLLLCEAEAPIPDVADMPGHKGLRMLAKHYRHRRGVVDLTDGQDRMLRSG